MHRILYHMDSDGHASGIVVYKHLREAGVAEEDIAWHPINYGMPIPPELNYYDDHVYVVDFSLQPLDVMTDFALKLGPRLTWIDHHSTSVDMEGEDEALLAVRGLREVDWDGIEPISGCELAWKYFYDEEPIPEPLKLVGEWDTWRWNQEPEARQRVVKAFQYYLRSLPSNPKFEDGRQLWMDLIWGAGESISDRLAVGETLLKYQEKQWKSTVGAMGFKADFQGLKVVMVNQKGNSEMFKGFFDPEKHDAMVTFQLIKGEYLTIALYTPHTDRLHLGELAKKVGEAGDQPSGGGHAGAAGFQCSWDYFKTLYTRTGDFTSKK